MLGSCNTCGNIFDRPAWLVVQKRYTCSKCRSEYLREWRKKHNGIAYGYYKKSKINNENRVKCRRLTRTAISNGTLIKQPCSVCGSEKSEAHHTDYTQPLNVDWLCRTHHFELHKNNES